MSTPEFEFGLDSPAYVSVDKSGQPLDGAVVIRNTIEEAVFALLTAPPGAGDAGDLTVQARALLVE